MDTTKHNQQAWDKKVQAGSPYTKPVNKETIKKSKSGEWEIFITPARSVPKDWFPQSLAGLKILCLASGGGQQAPVLAAAGADVTVVDLSKKQLEQDEMVARRDSLKIRTMLGDMTDLRDIANASFDLIIHPVSNLFVPDVRPVWKEASRVLKEGGILIAGFTNPLVWLFDDQQEQAGILDVKHAVPSSTLDHLSKENLRKHIAAKETIEYAHTLEDQIQGQIDAGFIITGFYEDDFGGTRLLDKYIKTFIATRAVKMNGTMGAR